MAVKSTETTEDHIHGDEKHDTGLQTITSLNSMHRSRRETRNMLHICTVQENTKLKRLISTVNTRSVMDSGRRF